ncbi:hypothetical protein CVT25_004459 [Psilocybe cyanescens]|uniref:RING-type E3 ubiquitin transferase n=1 Tax=Psilocybe cyanescens TaxID=93625 RepID=A0A409X2G7_PSICY|nr:hypothetical protein CVT25_004459 [Psilocybe cyanescens]
MTSPTSSPAAKRIKLEDLTPTHFNVESNEHGGNDSEIADVNEDNAIEEEEDENNCSICLHSVVDRTVIPKCSHEFCFECLLVWTEQSRRCPLCSQAIGEYLIHSIRSRYDYRKHYLSPLRTSPPPSRPAQTSTILQTTRQNARRRREREWGTRGSRVREHEEFDKLERSIIKRRWIYRHDLYAKHVASNSYTKYRPYPTPSQFTNSQELISRTTTFLRRELQVWEGLDVEFLTNLIISLMKAIDIRSESAVKLISEFLDMDEPYTPGGRHVNAEHFAHEVYCYVRSPYRDLFVYDTVVQYDLPPEVPPPPDLVRSRRWYPSSPPRSAAGPSQENRERRLRSRSRSSERGGSWSPSGRQYPSTRNGDTFNGPGTSANKNAEYDSHNRAMNVYRQDKKRSSISDDEIWLDGKNETREKDVPIASSKIMVSSSSSKNVKHMPENYRTKGKGKAYAEESPKAAIEHDMSETAKSTPDAEQIDRDPGLPPPDGKHMRNDVLEDVDPKPVPSRPTSARVLRTPRNNTLRDSVNAHLARNSKSTASADRTNLQSTRQLLANPNARTSVLAEVPPAPSDHTDIPPAPDTQAQSLSIGRQGGTRFVDISRVDSRGSNANSSDTRDTRVGSVRGNISDPSRSRAPRTNSISGENVALLPIAAYAAVEGGTGSVSTSEIEPSTKREREINARNSALSTKVIIDVHEPSSSSNINRAQNHGMCAAGAISWKEAVPSSKFSPKITFRKISPVQTTNHNLSRHSIRAVDDSVQAEERPFAIAFEHDGQKGIVAVHDHDVPEDPEIPGKDSSPIRKEGFTSADLITTLVNHSTVPRAIKTRTRLLARLEFEKKLACAPGLQNDADARGLREGPASTPASSSFDASSVHMDMPSKDDGSGGGDTHAAPQRPETSAQSLKGYGYSNSDPDPGYAEQEAREREARLRARIQLRARLAAEKRMVGRS